jgi:hypothetical protein
LGKHAASPQLARLLTEDVEHRAEVLNHYSRLCAAYRAEPYAGTITLILIEQDRRNPGFIGAWKSVAKNTTVYQFQKALATHAFAPLQNAGWIGRLLRHALAGPARTAGLQSGQAEHKKA